MIQLEAQAGLGVLGVYNFSKQQVAVLEVLDTLRRAIVAQPPSSPTKTVLLESYDKIFGLLAKDIGSCLIKPKLQKDITCQINKH